MRRHAGFVYSRRTFVWRGGRRLAEGVGGSWALRGRVCDANDSPREASREAANRKEAVSTLARPECLSAALIGHAGSVLITRVVFERRRAAPLTLAPQPTRTCKRFLTPLKLAVNAYCWPGDYYRAPP
ncbi:hypothetical protein E2C01_066867 [Portunus trituberculatus]|uniref:Uncharacterized protein n=1 Tax=Portunus trituberculatus TaxID=210409 RepID=A0A5B7HS45_PORTR|nr:hypothetical protein [Portunus trituberculatus]